MPQIFDNVVGLFPNPSEVDQMSGGSVPHCRMQLVYVDECVKDGSDRLHKCFGKGCEGKTQVAGAKPLSDEAIKINTGGLLFRSLFASRGICYVI